MRSFIFSVSFGNHARTSLLLNLSKRKGLDQESSNAYRSNAPNLAMTKATSRAVQEAFSKFRYCPAHDLSLRFYEAS